MQFVRVLLLGLAAAGAVQPSFAQSQYTGDGTPTGLEEEIRWKVNRGRFNSASENLLRGTAYTDVPASSGPLAPCQSITLSARHQSEDMAKVNLFQHATVPGSLYYNPITQPNPWDRMAAEGYSWNYAGENIAAGYSGSEAAYVGWWNSTGHRENMYNSAYREIGDGYYNWTASTYQKYYTMDLGNTGNNCFFTDTIFQDTNKDGIYEQTEGVAGVAILLVAGTSQFGSYDISSSIGSFAIPIQSIAGGVTVQVVLSNTTAATVTLSIPRDYTNYSTVSLAPGQSRVYGTFTQSATTRNVGLRDVTPAQIPVVAARLGLARTGTNMLLNWPSALGQSYQVQWTTNFVVWSGLTNAFQPGTGSNMTWLDAAAPARGPKFYRLLIHNP
jgi:uncharacterized protein YkwD